ncbi:AmmeMemoRadiSam system radical SAM enzyme [Candidatus Marinimicrobia bacterium MT.SAG.4]|nr:AmmeMemoRadiSam system radical SAM enzyme [Candidatus Marinimicrobia bacterium MT.SAG.4]
MNYGSEHAGRWQRPANNNRVECTLCPRYCKIPEGKAGFCSIRKNIDGTIKNIAYGRPTGFAVDPIEKKPLFHFLPGTGVLSFGTAGCNLGCKFCQNWHISKVKIDEANSIEASPEQVVKIAIDNNCPTIAFTYNDPTIWAEYAMDISILAKEVGIKSVWVTAGYITKEARIDAYENVDAANVDLKAFSQEFYGKITLSKLEPVLDTIKWLKNETDVWIEITNLIIPTLNDGDDEFKKMVDWITENLGEEVPLHFTAFHPDFKLKELPRTEASTLNRARKIALEAGLKYCYVGNVHDIGSSSTMCPNCESLLIERDWHSVLQNNIRNGKCPSCGTQIPGIFNSDKVYPNSLDT